MHNYYGYDEEEPWGEVQLTKEAIRARGTLMLYTALVTVPVVALVGLSAFLCGLKPYEVLGISCYNAMVSSIFFFDTLRNAAHDCFDTAQSRGLVTCRDGIPIIDHACPHRRLAQLSFAIGGRSSRQSPRGRRVSSSRSEDGSIRSSGIYRSGRGGR